MDRLIVKNFGPLKDVDIELNKINLFIGENGSGKSVLGKLVTIVLCIDESNENEILRKINEYNINFISNESIIELCLHDEILFTLKNKKIIFNDRFQESKNNLKQIYHDIEKYHKNASIFSENREEKHIKEFMDTIDLINENLKKIQPVYIPSERNLISIFSKSIYSFLSSDIPIPKFIIFFFSEFEKAKNEIKELSFLNVKYVNADKDRIYFNENEFLDLEHSSSGIQSALPLYLTVKYFAKKHQSIIIEEPEQNLFPKAQKETVEYIVEQMSDENSLFMMTHSPYVLTALNNLILANDVKTQKGVEAIAGIVKEEQCVAFEEVSAYSLVDGKSINIMDKEDRLIGVNLIDSISDEVSNTFDKLLAKLD